ncbi:unnamed protein product [Microthlaspi erraticum]|uniref:Uncharacterized protein n=1 Tax=Microthlaspi erraticum TaxID=1685480 RepID=A0A6D2HGP4_9BRAS|nr:unnamed protein product [Microthlaspi erraticum]
MDADWESKLLSQVTKLISLTRATDSYSNPRIEWNLESVSLLLQIISFVSSMDLDSQPKPESEFMSLIAQIKSFCKSMVFDSQPKPLPELISLINSFTTNDSDSDWIRKLESHIIQITSLASSKALNSQWDLRSLISETISLFNSTDLESKESKPLPELMSLVAQMIKMKSQLVSLITETMSLHPEPELVSLIHQVFTSVVNSMNLELQQTMPIDWKSKFEKKLFSLIAPLYRQ